MEKLFTAIREKAARFLREKYGVEIGQEKLGVNVIVLENTILARVFFPSENFRRINLEDGYFVGNEKEIPSGQVWINVFIRSKPWHFIPSIIEFVYDGKQVVADLIPHRNVVPLNRIVRG